MPRTGRAKESVRRVLEIPLHVPILANPSSNNKQKQLFLFHAEKQGPEHWAICPNEREDACASF